MVKLQRLHLEVTNVCNFKCEFCPDAIMGRARGHMDLGLLQKILTEIAETEIAEIVTFHLMGEPLIYPHIFTAITRALDLGIRLHLTTNGSTFALKPDQIRQLVSLPIPKVTISLQTPDPETFQIRGAPPHLTPDLYFQGITDYIHTHLLATSPTRVHIKFLDTTPHPFLVPHKRLSVLDNAAVMRAELLSWAKRLLAKLPEVPSDPWIQQQLNRYRPGRWQIIALHPRLALETFPLDSWGNVETARVYPASFGTCNGAAQQAGILYDGTVVPCCKDYEGLIPLGNVREKPLAEILMDQPACGLRQGFNHLQVKNPVCQRCIGADSHHKTLLRQLGSIAYFKGYRPLMQKLQPGWGDV
ncbi:MAG: radical SAM protein [Synechococcaceae cyanobacterium SM2_3_1]|nr:radical SAM protein [Synechococcaceae cyanobacterium SM2_3_1]